MKYLFFILIILVFVGCQPATEDPGYYCSKDIPDGFCEDLDKVCHLGECIPLTKKCGPSWGPLCEGQEKSHECTDEDEDNIYECTEAKCSRTYKEGYCDEDKKCILGRCKDRCSAENPTGFCDDNKTCIQGDCLSEPFCGTEIGECPNSKTCISRTEGGYECVELCSEAFPEGLCDTGKECQDGSCLRTERLCTVVEDASDGECPSGKICIAGTDGNECVAECSETNPTGACREDGKECVDNVCTGVCSEEFFPNGYCPDEKECRQGSCVNLCSATHSDGFCEEGTCTNGECVSVCSPTNLDGACEDGKSCNENGVCVDFCDPACSATQTCILGVCNNNCSPQHTDGYCEDSDKQCTSNGECKGACSTTELNGYCVVGKVCSNLGRCLPSCASDPGGYCPNGSVCDGNGHCVPTCDPACSATQTCLNNSCEDNCSFDHPDGYCENNEYCLEGSCKGDCSASELDGYCESGKCMDGICKSGEELPCSPENLVGFCDATHTCVSGSCTQNCAFDHLDGYCADNKYCMAGGACRDACSNSEPEGYCATGECQGGTCHSDSSCSDNRPSSGMPGSCCVGGEDCQAGGSNPVCADGIEGKYCYNIGSVCNTDSQCSDPFSEYGTTQHYYCNKVDYIFNATSHGYLSFCEQVPDSCIATGRTKNLGENCNEECGDYECRSGNQCVKGVCVVECASGNDNDCILNGTVCSPTIDTYPGSYWNGSREGGVNRMYNTCKHECGGNNDCGADQRCNSLFDPSYRVFDMKAQDNPNGNSQAPFIQTCTSDLSRKADGESCTESSECNNDICYQNKCQKICKDDDNCDNDEYCNNSIFTLQHTYYTGSTEDISKLGLCIKLEAGTVRGPSCTNVSDCPNTTFTVLGQQVGYECIWRVNRNSYVDGVCGIRADHNSYTYRGIGGSCDGVNNLCESGICHQTVCKSLCSTTSQCDSGYLCYRAKATQNSDRLPYSKANIYQSESVGGVCLNLGSVTDCTTTSCGAGTTCIHNLVNDAHDVAEPWKLGVEYKCVGAQNGFSIGHACASNSECSSYTCNTIDNVCTIACTQDSQCSGIGNETCYNTYNIGTIENRINAGICR